MLKKILKILQWIIIAVLVIFMVFTGYIYYQFNYYQPEDTAQLNEKNLQYFNDNYVNSRSDFRNKLESLKTRYPDISLHSFQVPSKIDNDLTVDYCLIPALKDSSKLLVISSGTHGVEAYTGSAVQQMFLEELITDELLQNTGILMIHSINPYGFKYGRRVTENNVDLNRNSYFNDDLYATVNDGYPLVKDFINPEDPLDLNSFFHRLFFLPAVNKIRQSGMGVLRQAILQGQYQYPDGLYFGGHNQEPQIDSLIPIITNMAKPYDEILAFDLHTGYGERGKMHLFPNPVDEDLQLKMEKLFDGYHIDWGDSDDFYTVTGDFVNFIGQLNPGKKFIPMTLEFGTMDSQTTLGSMKSLQIMIAENQGFHYGYFSNDDKDEMNQMFLEMYHPSSPVWKSHCIDQSRAIFEDVLPKFTQTK